MSSNQKVAVVTGAGTGVGKSATLHLLADGYSVALAGRRVEHLEEVVAESGVSDSKAIIMPTDVGNPEDVENLFNSIKSTYGRLDVLFNNAGIGAPRIPFEDLSLEDWQRVIDTNLTGSFLCSQQAIKIMKEQTPIGGRIINNGSIAAYAPRPDGVAYTSTKHAISGLTKQISLDGRKYNIACSQIDIGNAGTPMTARMKDGVIQPNGDIVPEPTFDVNHVGETVLYIANLPLETNIQFMTIMATKMPFIGRG